MNVLSSAITGDKAETRVLGAARQQGGDGMVVYPGPHLKSGRLNGRCRGEHEKEGLL
jgi:hypothetical protein